MLSRFSRWGRAAAYLVVLIGMPVWLLTAAGSQRGAGMDAGPPGIILVAAYVAYLAGSMAERKRADRRRKRILSDNREV